MAFVEARTDVVLPGAGARRGWIVDILNGTEQELDVTRVGDDTVLRALRIKDYPTLIRLR
jgi:hypothetical protein